MKRRRAKDEYVSTEHLLLALVEEKQDDCGHVLREYGATPDAVLRALESVRGSAPITDQDPESKYQALAKSAATSPRSRARGKLDPVVGRDEEIRRVVQVLSRRTKNNPVLIGEPGVGKTAIVEGLAQRIINGDVPETLLKNRRVVVSMDIGAMHRRGQVPRRIRGPSQGVPARRSSEADGRGHPVHR